MALLSNGRQYGDLGYAALNQFVTECFHASGARQGPMLASLSTPDGEASLFIEHLLPPPRLIIVGAVHLAIPLATLAKTMNFRTIVVDARSAFATRARFPHVDELAVEWPGDALKKLDLDASACVVCLSHDPKLDNPALLAALDSPAGYIGALGSRRAHAKRLDVLREEGVGEEALKRIHAPIGLNLGARQPEEIALAILAEIVSERHTTISLEPSCIKEAVNG
jgi:xanthine dehydrogenase accessory factor